MPRLSVRLGNLRQMRHIGLRLLVRQRPSDKVLLHIDYHVDDDFFVAHSCNFLSAFATSILQYARDVKGCGEHGTGGYWGDFLGEEEK